MDNPSDLAKLITSKIDHRFYKDDLSNEDLIYICKQCLKNLNAKPISQYAKQNNISRQGVYKFRPTTKLLGRVLVIDNE